MTKKTKEEKKEAQEVLAKFISEHSNKTIEESFNVSEKFLNEIKAKLEHKDIEINSIFQVLDNVDYHQPIYLKSYHLLVCVNITCFLFWKCRYCYISIRQDYRCFKVC